MGREIAWLEDAGWVGYLCAVQVAWVVNARQRVGGAWWAPRDLWWTQAVEGEECGSRGGFARLYCGVAVEKGATRVLAKKQGLLQQEGAGQGCGRGAADAGEGGGREGMGGEGGMGRGGGWQGGVGVGTDAGRRAAGKREEGRDQVEWAEERERSGAG